jgi:DNA (cytosine-5)-methyltransferase 1
MADGSQLGFNIPRHLPVTRLHPGEIVVDLFAGGGGASVALEQALQRAVDIAINHDEFAVGMHAANHPLTRHMREDVWVADPREIAGGRVVGWLHASPDCTHFSQARGGQPRSRKTRSLSWVVVKWAGRLHKAGLGPRYISLENVEQILTWGPLIAKRDKATGRVLKMDGSVAASGEQVPVGNQQLIPDKKRAGRTWDRFVAILHGLGYDVEWKKVVAADHGAGTSRKRLFLIARCDGLPIVWPAATHGPGRAHPYVTAADCIDWTIPGKSIFGRKKDLADATMRRIARGIKRYVIDAAEPFIVPATIIEHANASREAAWSAEEPLRTQCANVKGGHFALASATLIQTGYGEAPGQAPRVPGLGKPVGTLVDGQKHGLVTAFLEQAAGGPNSNTSRPRAANEPVSTITQAGSQQRVVEAHMAPSLSPEQEEGALRVAAFLINYYGNGQALDLRDAVDTITTRDRLALVTVHVRGVPHLIVDITLRMLTPPELYRAQGFPPDYIIDRTADGRKLTVSQQVRMVGNSVSPPPLFAIVDANLEPVAEPMRMAA